MTIAEVVTEGKASREAFHTCWPSWGNRPSCTERLTRSPGMRGDDVVTEVDHEVQGVGMTGSQVLNKSKVMVRKELPQA